MRPIFQVKICGVTTAADALVAADAGADAVGLNFVPGSPRALDPAMASGVAAAVPRGVLRVGVFAGAPAGWILEVAATVGLDAVQLHGPLFPSADAAASVDPPEACAALAPLPVIRAVRLDAGGLAAARRWIALATAAGRGPVLAIVDASPPAGAGAGQLGGTGARVDWEGLRRAGGLDVPLALAGGLTPGNVAEAVRATGCAAVDVASGVEAAPGRKDPAKTRAFVAAARAALGLG